jgi:uncharacterized membrane protein
MNLKKAKVNKNISLVIYLIVIPIFIYIGMILLNNKKYNLISIAVAIIACIPIFISFEKGKTTTRELVVIAVMTALSVVGRIIFMPVPGFKPVTALVIITGIAFGSQVGFLTGSLTALISNFIYGQGAWTPFQMFVWGFIGLLSGLVVKNRNRPNILLLIVMAVLGGIMYSLLMDVWTTLSYDNNVFNISRYMLFVVVSLPVLGVYVVSNIVFVVILTYPILEILNRIKQKYGVFKKFI